jgi:hypothetical protein
MTNATAYSKYNRKKVSYMTGIILGEKRVNLFNCTTVFREEAQDAFSKFGGKKGNVEEEE